MIGSVQAARPRLLVSVRDAGEAALAQAAGADLIDAKDPNAGALEALPLDAVRAIVAAVAGRATVSAVAAGGEADALAPRVRALAATGVDLVKVALRDFERDGAAQHSLLGGCPVPVVAVLFAEDGIDPGRLPRLAEAGFAGAMIDTRLKGGRRLVDLLAAEPLNAFVRACEALGLLSGLAGSLRPDDIPALAPLRPTYLGFRGGLCRDGDRRGALDPARVAEAARRLAAAVPSNAAA